MLAGWEDAACPFHLPLGVVSYPRRVERDIEIPEPGDQIQRCHLRQARSVVGEREFVRDPVYADSGTKLSQRC